MTTETLANAGQGAAASSAPISGEGTPASNGSSATASTPANGSAPASKPETGMQAAFERAKSKLDGGDGKQPQTGQDRARSQDGKFAAKTQDAAKAQPEAAANAPTADLKPLAAPQRWPETRRKFFEAQPREIQEALLDLNNDWSKGFSKQAEEFASHKKYADDVRGLLTDDMRALAQKAGMDDVGAIKHSLQMVQMFNRDPITFMGQYMARRGIDPRVFISGQTPEGQPMPSPAQQLAPILAPLANQVQALEADRAARERQAQEQRASTIEATISQFVAETDATGAPKYPHLESVTDRMMQLLSSDPRLAAMDDRQKLETAYQTAVWENPDLRAELVTAEATKKAEAMEQARTAERLKAAATVKPSASASGTPAKGKGLNAAFERAQARVGQK